MSGISSAKIVATVTAVAAVCMIGPGIAQADAASVPLRMRAIQVAEHQKGDWYAWGAAGPSRFDCSGLVYYSYKKAGKTLPRTAQAQYNKVKHISAKNARVGDLIFFGSKGSIYHVGFYSSRSHVLHAPHTGAKVRAEKLWTKQIHYGRL